MGKIKNKLIDWKNRLKDRHMLSVIVVLFTIIIILSVIIYKKQSNVYFLFLFERLRWGPTSLQTVMRNVMSIYSLYDVGGRK